MYTYLPMDLCRCWTWCPVGSAAATPASGCWGTTPTSWHNSASAQTPAQAVAQAPRSATLWCRPRGRSPSTPWRWSGWRQDTSESWHVRGKGGQPCHTGCARKINLVLQGVPEKKTLSYRLCHREKNLVIHVVPERKTFFWGGGEKETYSFNLI